MSYPLFRYAIEDYHSKYMACAQGINWCPECFDHTGGANGFIVQEILHERIVDSVKEYGVHYFEAWEVKDGICLKDKDQDYDDLFSVGYPYDLFDAMRKSIGHYGTIFFHPKVIWVDEKSAAYFEVSSWDTTVKEAHGLKSVYYSDLINNVIGVGQLYERDCFTHEWEFLKPQEIYEEVLDYCRRMWDSNTVVGRKNFDNGIEELFPDDSYLDIKRKIQEEWGYSK